MANETSSKRATAKLGELPTWTASEIAEEKARHRAYVAAEDAAFHALPLFHGAGYAESGHPIIYREGAEGRKVDEGRILEMAAVELIGKLEDSTVDGIDMHRAQPLAQALLGLLDMYGVRFRRPVAD